MLGRADNLYKSYQLRRVYYSGFSPIPEPSKLLPLKAPPLVREHRLYQADWLLRFYGFKVEELVPASQPNLQLEIDPKLAWALQHRGIFPVDVNKAPLELARIVTARRHCRLHVADLKRLRLNLGKCLPFLVTVDHVPRTGQLDGDAFLAGFLPKPQQMELNFSTPPAATLATAQAALTGEF